MLFDVFLPESGVEQKKRANGAAGTTRIPRLPATTSTSPKRLDISNAVDGKVTTRLYAIPSVTQPTDDHWNGTYRANSEIQQSNSRRPSQMWRPVGQLSLSSDVTSRSWKAVRFATSCSRGCNTTATHAMSRGVQTLPTSFQLRLNVLPLGKDVPTPSGWYHRLCTRRLVSLFFSQLGLTVFVAAWVTSSAALFHHLERFNDQKLVDDVALQRSQLVLTLTSELRQVGFY